MKSSNSIVSWGAAKREYIRNRVSSLFNKKPQDQYAAAPVNQQDLDAVPESDNNASANPALQGNSMNETGKAATCAMLDDIQAALSFDQPQQTDTDRP